MIAKNRDEAVSLVLVGLQALIGMGAEATVARSYRPTNNPDDDDDVIAAGKEQVAFLRHLRTQFENALMLGEYTEYTSAKVYAWFDAPQEGLDNHTPRQMGLRAP